MLNVENISFSRITVASHLTASDLIWCPVIEDLLYIYTYILPLTGPGLRPTVQNSSYYKNGQNFPEYLGQGTLDAVHFLVHPLGASAAPQTFLLTTASYSHSTSIHASGATRHRALRL